jgi:hypothetical protein
LNQSLAHIRFINFANTPISIQFDHDVIAQNLSTFTDTWYMDVNLLNTRNLIVHTNEQNIPMDEISLNEDGFYSAIVTPANKLIFVDDGNDFYTNEYGRIRFFNMRLYSRISIYKNGEKLEDLIIFESSKQKYFEFSEGQYDFGISFSPGSPIASSFSLYVSSGGAFSVFIIDGSIDVIILQDFPQDVPGKFADTSKFVYI